MVAAALALWVAPANAATTSQPSPFELPCPGVTTCPQILYNPGGTIQHDPRLYLLFWGSQWTSAPYNGYLNKVVHFFHLLPGSDWEQSLQQYTDAGGPVGRFRYGGAALDPSDPPVLTESPDAQIDPEIEAVAASQNWTMNFNTTVVVYTEPGKSDVTYCGVHGGDGGSDGAKFAWIPYPGDTKSNGSTCRDVYPNGSTNRIPLFADMTWTATHEIAEDATNANNAWQISPSDNGNEIGDPCNGLIAPFDEDTAFFVQYLMDRTSGECADYQAIQPTPIPTGATLSELTGVSCIAWNACWAVGYFYDSSEAQLTLAEYWNGTNWSIQPTPNPTGATGSSLSAVSCVSASDCTAVGSYASGSGLLTLAEAWNGTSWSIETTANPGGTSVAQLSGVSCASTTACTAVGYSESPGPAVTLAEFWNGTSWSLQSTPNPVGEIRSYLVAVSCTSASACTAVGESSFETTGQVVTLAEAWNGTRWSVKPSPNASGSGSSYLSGVSCWRASGGAPRSCMAVGAGAGVTLGEFWNGSSWSIVSTADPSGAASSALNAVSCSAAFRCTAMGNYTDTSGVGRTLAEAFLGGWSIEPTPNPAGAMSGSALGAVSCVAADICTAVGNYHDTSDVVVTLAEAE
jgi:hypothetical protein